MSTRTHRPRTPYARALYAAALAALLSACAQKAPTPAAQLVDVDAAPQAVEATMPEVVVTASREMPEVVVVASREHANSRG
jgi:type IV pilus biogenesis protein CpaD/CtpE